MGGLSEACAAVGVAVVATAAAAGVAVASPAIDELVALVGPGLHKWPVADRADDSARAEREKPAPLVCSVLGGFQSDDRSHVRGVPAQTDADSIDS